MVGTAVIFYLHHAGGCVARQASPGPPTTPCGTHSAWPASRWHEAGDDPPSDPHGGSWARRSTPVVGWAGCPQGAGREGVGFPNQQSQPPSRELPKSHLSLLQSACPTAWESSQKPYYAVTLFPNAGYVFSSGSSALLPPAPGPQIVRSNGPPGSDPADRPRSQHGVRSCPRLRARRRLNFALKGEPQTARATRSEATPSDVSAGPDGLPASSSPWQRRSVARSGPAPSQARPATRNTLVSSQGPRHAPQRGVWWAKVVPARARFG